MISDFKNIQKNTHISSLTFVPPCRCHPCSESEVVDDCVAVDRHHRRHPNGFMGLCSSSSPTIELQWIRKACGKSRFPCCDLRCRESIFFDDDDAGVGCDLIGCVVILSGGFILSDCVVKVCPHRRRRWISYLPVVLSPIVAWLNVFSMCSYMHEISSILIGITVRRILGLTNPSIFINGAWRERRAVGGERDERKS